MDKKFIEQCEHEIEIREKIKGKWSDWNPNIKELYKELSWHFAKLNKAFLEHNFTDIQKQSNHLANICEKSFLFVKNNSWFLICNQCKNIEKAPYDEGDKCYCGGTFILRK